MANSLWFLVIAIGPILLGGAIAFALMRRRRLSAGEKRRQKQAVERLYDKRPEGQEPSLNGR